MNIKTNLKNDIIVVNTRYISCNGGEGILGHPLVYYEIKEDLNEISCGYCGKRFVYKHQS